MRAVMIAASLVAAFVAAPGARADVGIIPTLVEGFGAETENRRAELDGNIAQQLGPQHVRLRVGPECALDPKCVVAAAEASAVEVDEVAQVVLTRTGGSTTEMRLRIFGSDGQVAHEMRAPIADDTALESTTELLRKAFDPSRYRGFIEVKGAPEGAQLLVDAVPLSEPRAELRVGPHVLDVVHDGGAVERVPFEVTFERTTEVVVPSAIVPTSGGGGAPFTISVVTAAAGLTAVAGAVILGFFSVNEHAEWERRALGRTFMLNGDDPVCRAADACIAADGRTQLGWTRDYGPGGAGGQVGQGARFMMVAMSRDNEERWQSSIWASVALGIAGGMALTGGAVGAVALFGDE